MKAKLLPFLIPLILFLGLVKVHDVLYDIYPLNHRSIAFGLTVNYAWMIFGISLLLFNIYMAITDKFKYTIGLIFFITSIILPFEAVEFRPFRATLIMIIFLSGFGLSIMLNQMVKKKGNN